MNDYHRCFPAMEFNPPASEDAVIEHERRLMTRFPACYREFLLEADGAIGFEHDSPFTGRETSFHSAGSQVPPRDVVKLRVSA
jgi:hypothetical protein